VSAPKTPLPWGTSHGVIFAPGEKWSIGSFVDGSDARYAVHAANVLPEVVAALRETLDLADAYLRGRFVNVDGHDDVIRWRAALAKADAS